MKVLSVGFVVVMLWCSIGYADGMLNPVTEDVKKEEIVSATVAQTSIEEKIQQYTDQLQEKQKYLVQLQQETAKTQNEILVLNGVVLGLQDLIKKDEVK